MQDERIIELIAKPLDEPLTPSEQAEVNEALQKSLALRVAAEGLHEFDALLKRTGMAIPDDGFPARVLARLEIYERQRNRVQWLLTLGILFLGSLVAVVWFLSSFSAIIENIAQELSTLADALPVLYDSLFILTATLGRGPLLLYALIVLVLTLIWARVSWATTYPPTQVSPSRQS
ncbi:MAG TPA: hypothetical protein VFD70_00235 [Anaerolineae bacterium]|nr:hypothetical protein [Anaerolineae bacterium]